jgi:phage terminase large subunit-like protein
MLDLASRLANELETGWSSLARPSQLPPPGDWTIWALVMGRGAGKTRAGAEWVRSLVESGEGTRIAIISATAADGRDIVVEGESGILAISPDWNRPTFEPSKRRISWPSGAIASLFSSEEPERLRGQQFTHAWCDELGSWQNQEQTFDQLMFCLRLGKRPRCCVTTTPRPTKVLKNLFERNGKDVIIVRESSYANRANLPPSFFADIIAKYEGTRLGRQELQAELLLDTPGALWNMGVIEELRVARNQVPSIINTPPTELSPKRTKAALWLRQLFAPLIRMSRFVMSMPSGENCCARSRSRRYMNKAACIMLGPFRSSRIK